MTSFCQGYRFNLSTPSANPAGVACSSTFDAGPGFDDPFLFLAEFLWGVARARARGKGVMVDATYADGARYLPSDAEVRAMRPQD